MEIDSNVVHDVDLQNLPVRFAIDKADLVGVDGPTHYGAFDTIFMICLLNTVLMAPSCESELINMVATMAVIDDKPSGFSYLKGNGIDSIFQPNYNGTPLELEEGESEERRK
ncbi:hypothetical protein LguiA_002867 [Lonicera macranthoides]